MPKDRRRGRLVRIARKRYLGFTQKEMGDWMGVDKNTIARWERGEMNVPQIAKNFILYFYRMEVFKGVLDDKDDIFTS